ncbi:spheroidene monooxygenase [Thetidibacter halocola]|uniref:Spheroidene monooxygenase n=1 Tax=Thetidibacter halocola TaxID=2827239 RepID=A0A8J7WDP2_9RHOB|nr:spheroidene monooxygenase [Thetidibacter halocola]MBS0123446.1 spheroidene monooxygenase [Thetidibacter halocola]
MQTVSLSLFRFDGLASRLWAFAMMGLARGQLSRVPDLGFWKLCGSGTGEGFTPVPNTAVYAILATWPDPGTAMMRTTQAPVFERYRRRATENWTLLLNPITARGVWSGHAPFQVQTDAGSGPVAALTRATVRPREALRFWRRVPDISTAIGADPNVMFKIGIGEVPLLHQITFSVWPDSRSMAHFAREDGPHARAIRAVRDGDWFAEELYARFRIVGEHGRWEGRSPRILKEVSA